MRQGTVRKVDCPDKIRSYFRLEWATLLIVTISGIAYNVGLTAGPYFEGQLVQRLFDILAGRKAGATMLPLAAVYLLVILAVQGVRCVKRFYVRRFANNTARDMRHILYNNLVHQSRAQLYQQSVGAVMTKAVADVDACAEGMRKVTTELFDTGVALLAYLALLLSYDWRLALISCAFTPPAYLIAGQLGAVVARYNAAYKKSAGELNGATMDRIINALTYRVAGQEQNRDAAYESRLTDYEKRAVSANLWESTMQPIYYLISMCGAVPIVWFGAKNIQGTGWASWDIAAFTTFLACFAKLAIKSSKAAKLFNSIQKAKVSWQRIRPLMKAAVEPDTRTDLDFDAPVSLTVSHLSFSYPEGSRILRDLSFSVRPGQIIGVTGVVASGKSTLGKLFLAEEPYEGSIRIGERELCDLSEYERSRLVAYQGHQPELMSDTLAENIRLGGERPVEPYLREVCLHEEVSQMPDGAETYVGSGGVRLSGGQQARVALARALYGAGHLLVLDDPFSAVDSATERAIFRQLREREKDKMILLISHRLDLFPELDQVIWLSGEESRVSNHPELMRTCPAYAELYEIQTAGGDLDEKD